MYKYSDSNCDGLCTFGFDNVVDQDYWVVETQTQRDREGQSEGERDTHTKIESEGESEGERDIHRERDGGRERREREDFIMCVLVSVIEDEKKADRVKEMFLVVV